jgi:serine/threonine-protein kinase
MAGRGRCAFSPALGEEGPIVRKNLDLAEEETLTDPSSLGTLLAAETLLRPARPLDDVVDGLDADPDRIGRYIVRGVLGEGSMGRIYRAYDPAARREVAVKVLKAPFATDPRAVERFRREAAAARGLVHPALVGLLDVGEDYLVQELVEGESLAARLRRRGPIGLADALPIFDAVAEALDYVHSRGVVHRDVKPSNVLLVRGGAAKLADFGIARLCWAPMTRTGEIIGSPAYMAPEQLTRGIVHPRSDIYSLAVVVHETLTGARPFRRPSLGALLESIVADDPPRASLVNAAVPAAVDAVLGKALAKAPEDRYPDGQALAAALRDVLDRSSARGAEPAFVRERSRG